MRWEGKQEREREGWRDERGRITDGTGRWEVRVWLAGRGEGKDGRGGRRRAEGSWRGRRRGRGKGECKEGKLGGSRVAKWKAGPVLSRESVGALGGR